jgi:DNA polymerase-3 subunit epsilon
MDTRRYAFVDLETTGVSPADDRITEIAIIRVDGDVLRDEWSSLVDPGIPIPPEIQALTGITDAAVRGAPRFPDLIQSVAHRLDGRILVAHNARFDYGFLKSEFRRAGDRISAEVLCTVRLSRRLFPQHTSHRLDALIARHRLPVTERHRALGDARAIRAFVSTVWREEDPQQVDAALRALLREPAIPPYLDTGGLEHLPESPGVYAFVGVTGQPLYVGKARNLRERVRGHFYADSRNANDARLAAEVRTIEIETTAGEFGALLREAARIKACVPLHNVALRRRKGICFIRPVDPGRPPAIALLSSLDNGDPLSCSDLYGPFSSRATARRLPRSDARTGCAIAPSGCGRARGRASRARYADAQGCAAQKSRPRPTTNACCARSSRCAFPTGRSAVRSRCSSTTPRAACSSGWCSTAGSGWARPRARASTRTFSRCCVGACSAPPRRSPRSRADPTVAGALGPRARLRAGDKRALNKRRSWSFSNWSSAAWRKAASTA